MARVPRIALSLVAALLLPAGARAQLSQLTSIGGTKGPASNQPVTFTADSLEYDREHALVIARGHVEAWQNNQVLRADQITFDRNTGVAAAKGNVVLLTPDGQVMFADYAELAQGMKEGVLTDMRAILAENGRLAANGARRTGGEINELSRVVYSTCNLCAKHPESPPLWQLRARTAVQDGEHKKIEYWDAVMEMYGVPVAFIPYFWHVDPSVKRASGLLIPSMGVSSHIGAFARQPYYWVIDDQSDATITPMMTSRGGPNLEFDYRHRFNNGYLTLNTSAGYEYDSLQGTIFTKGQFNVNDTWRWGFDLERASSSNYVRDFNFGSLLEPTYTILTSQIYAEGFGEGAYSLIDTRFYQGLTSTVVDSKLPVVLPRYTYSYFSEPDGWGGRLSLDTGAFNVMRTDGTSTRRASLTMNYAVPFTGPVGDLWKVQLHGDAAAYNAGDFNNQPNWGTTNSISTARGLPQAAVMVRWPFMRDSGAWGTQIIEPIAQIIVAPQSGNSQYNKYPNEDSLDLEFTDQNLFSFNRFPGIDRLEGGQRLNAGLHGAWYLGGTAFDGLIGQSYQPGKNNLFPEATGLHDQVSDVVARTTFTPTNWLDLTYRTRLDHRNLAVQFADATASVSGPHFSVSGGYLYTVNNPYTYYDQPPTSPAPPPAGNAFYTPRNEVTLGGQTNWGHYRFAAYGRRDLQLNQMVSLGADAIYEDECFIVDLKYNRRYTSFNGDSGSQSVMIQLTFKTVGAFGFRAH